jgi:NDP-sugar pyrophosphorylase family protein
MVKPESQKMKRGMVLAAGLGTRLLPITEKCPKPLVPVLNVPNILYSLFLLKRCGIEDVILNLHHLPESIQNFLKAGENWGMHLSYSKETLLLGTGGGVKKAEPFFKKEPFVLVNCDFITNLELSPLIDKHFEQGSKATMILLENAELQAFYGKVGTDKEGYLCSLPTFTKSPPVRTGIFTGVHLLDSSVFQYLHEAPSGINQVLYPALMKDHPKQVRGLYLEKNYWMDTGELQSFWSTSMKLLEKLQSGEGWLREFLKTFGKYEERKPGLWLPEGEAIPENLLWEGPVILGKNCKIGPRTKIGPFAVLGNGSIVGEEAQVTRFVALENSQIPAYQVSSGALQFESTLIPMPSKPAIVGS